MEIFCFLLGILFLYTFSPASILVSALFFYISPRKSLLIFFLLGALVAWIHEALVAPKGMPDLQVVPQALLSGHVDSIPIRRDHKTQFVFAIEQLNGKPVEALVLLSWYQHASILHAGEHWLLHAKIKRPHNFSNPGSNDYQTALRRRHLLWTGYVRSGKKEFQLKNESWNWLLFRERLDARLTQLAPNQQIAGVVEALTLNLSTHISQSDWELFRRTGTIHLFGISGEHIALIFGMVFGFVRWLWSRSAFCCLRVPATAFASLCGFLVAAAYSFLAGFEPPVQRALIGCFFYMLSCLGYQRLTAWQVWRYALLGVLCLEPHAVFMQGFYFSFLAVACLLLTQQRWQFKGYKATLVLQLSCLLGLMPLTLYWYSYGSVNGFLANVLAIPLVGFLIMPLALVLLCISSWSWSALIMKPLSWLIFLLLGCLHWVEHLAFMNINWAIPSIHYVLAFMGALLCWLLLPLRPFNYFGLLWAFIPFFPAKTTIRPGEVLIQILDVGQGLAVSIQTQTHVLLYDTGDKFFQGSDLGQMVIVPFYQQKSIKKLDMVVISHPDKDHRGGLNSVQSSMQVGRLIVSSPKDYQQPVTDCHQYPVWDWDGVRFRFLPIRAAFPDKNNRSCILQIDNGLRRILLVGDIERKAEDYLVRYYGKRLASDLLVVPHHGSKTSSSYRFLLEVSPQYAIASLGFDNRFHFPHAKTVKTMQDLGIHFLRTDECGMTEFFFDKKGELKPPRCYNPHPKR